MKYSWATINGVSKFNAAKPCVKQYLSAHVKTQFRKVDSEDWVTAMLLPVERFTGASKQEVWEESKKKISKALIGRPTSISNRKKFFKKVSQYNNKGIFIKRYDSVKDAANELNVSSAAVSMVCNGARNTLKGFLFKFEK